MIGVKSNAFSENAGEPEQDANSALTELDKGLRSGKVGEQCEAIVRFPRMFEKYPFPILINSSFLKLADVFRMGNNFLRLWVLRVCQQSEKHLDKILNVDEFLRRVFSVLHSNDPVARALTLRTLGAVAGIIPERQNVHHAIRRGLDSHDNVEVEAAIYATTRFAAHSNAFAVAMCNKLTDMIECESTGAERREKLVLALRTVHGGAVRAQGVLKLLRSLLERFPSTGSVRAAIVAITAIASDTVVHVPDQVELLLQIATNDPRASIRRAALHGLKQLAEHASLWPNKCIQDLLTVAECDTGHGMLCLEVMKKLVECGSVCATASSSPGGARSPLLVYCITAALSAELRVAATAATVLTRIIVHCYEECLPVESGVDLVLALETIVIATGREDSKSNVTSLRKALSCLVQLCNAEPASYAQRTAHLLGAQLRACGRGRVPRQTGLLEALAALGGSVHSPAAVAEAMDDVESVLADVVNNPHPQMDGTALVLLCTIIFQERAGVALTMKITNEWEQTVLQALVGYDGWTRYRVARAALRYGHHSVAASVLAALHSQAECETTQRWLHALWQAAVADSLVDDIGECASRYQIIAGHGSTNALCLPQGWLHARAAAHCARGHTAAAAAAFCSQPPPATAQAARDPASKSGACAAALRKAARRVAAAAAVYGDIAKTAFHADDNTLNLLHIYQHTFKQMSQFLDRITCSTPTNELVIKEWKPNTLEEKIALAPSVALANISRKLFDDPTTAPGVTHRHILAVQAVNRLISPCIWPRGALTGRGGAPLCRLALSPAPRAGAADAPTSLPLSHRLALKMEAVLLPPPYISKRQPRRQVKSVQITVTATPHSRNNDKSTDPQPITTAVQLVQPVRDFFSAQQLLSVSSPGLYTVAVEAAFVDEFSQLWTSPPPTTITVKAHEDPGVKGNSQNNRGRF